MANEIKGKDGQRNARDVLLETACEFFGEQGFRLTRTQDICKKAGTNPAAVNYYFGGKEGLYKAVWDFAVETAVISGNLPSLSENEDRKWLYHYVRASVIALFDTGSGGLLRRLVRHELDDPSPFCDELLGRRMAPRSIELENRLRRMLGSDATDYQLACCVVAVTSQCSALGLNDRLKKRLFSGDEPLDDEVRLFARELCAFIIGGIRAIRVIPKPKLKQNGTVDE